MRSFGNKESENIDNNPETFPCLNICSKPSTNKNDAEFIKNLTANPRISVIPSTSRGMDAINIYFKRDIYQSPSSHKDFSDEDVTSCSEYISETESSNESDNELLSNV
ncbi:unnamed protein product [Acanthoscelides obtectus]|uniref:Uncharacterized protein n=1 Tax=Acanthoscelides obtectus TaxID=200917 RepID=A0A9P0L8A8_ACAOB|nr:unnamed protein product [Acanthoscelides obtectus]CAK1640644.1 hypothetical protein AOBTE_LOCUS11840 [Acanthoscelides obtectus]